MAAPSKDSGYSNVSAVGASITAVEMVAICDALTIARDASRGRANREKVREVADIHVRSASRYSAILDRLLLGQTFAV